jgi:hypothetical protein
MTATVQWQAYAGVTHAWLAQCEGYVSLCGREVSGFGGQRSGIRCAQCVNSSGWAEATGQESYLTPQRPMDMDAMFNSMKKVRGTPRSIGARTARAPRAQNTLVPFVPLRAQTIIVAPDTPDAGLQVPDTPEAYQRLPEAEQRYWAPVMLARAGQSEVWDQSQETAEDFQRRCVERLAVITQEAQ